MELFPSVPEDLEAVGADELQGVLEEFKTIGAGIKADLSLPEEERKHIAGMSAADVTEALKGAAETKLRIEEHLSGIEEAEGNFVAAVDESLAALGVEDEPLAAETDPEPDDEPAPDEPAPDDEAEVLAAEVEPEPTPAPRMSIPRGPSSMEPQAPVPVAEKVGATFYSTEALKPIAVRENTEIANFDQFAEHVVKLAKRRGSPQHVRGGGRERIPMASAAFSFPDEFVLSDSRKDNLEKIRPVSSAFLGKGTELEIFQASGGICAPPTPFYDVPGFASRARPVRAALPSYMATRGGVSVPSVNIVDRTDDGVTIIEESEDAQGGTFSVKACRAVTCATWSDTFVGIISHCLEVGNLNAMTWPEGVALEEDNLMAGWAAAAETRLLNRIKSLSVKSHTTHVYNSVHDLIYGIVRAKASIRSVLRAEFDAGFTALIPEWIREELVADLAAQSGNADRYVGVGGVEAYLTRLGITVAWYKDSPTTGVSQIFGTQADDGLADPATDSLDDFPVEAQVGLFLNGTFLHLDGGSLELGLVRDSTLNETNDYELFGESFENVARIGPAQAARWLTMGLCPSGQFPALATALSCS